MLARKILKSGSGLPIVFLHGFLGRAEDWEPVVSFLPSWSCIGFDLPGHGDSPFVEEFSIDIPRFHLVGYSLGGRIAMAFAAKHPEQIASLSILSAHPGLQSEEEKQRRLIADAEWAKLLLELPIDEFLNRWYDQSIFKSFRPDLTMRNKQNIPALASAIVHYSLGLQPRYEVAEPIVGERDEKFRALYKNPILVPNAGHIVHLENPRKVAEILQTRIGL
jgi:2-succinyl-6-hydroxy-2,4-cyclohexadiene-1-carboxylate synthase